MVSKNKIVYLHYKILIMNKKYRIIVADPPWQYGSKSAVNNSNGSEIKKLSEHYKSMSTDDIKSLPIKNILLEDACCFLWVTDSHLKEGIEVMEKWGFKYKTIAFNWVKTTNKGNIYKNVAPWTLKSSEICIFGTRGKMTQFKINNSVESLIFAERNKHSQKPLEYKKRIVEMFGDQPTIELFARDCYEQWECLGDGLNGEDIRISLSKMIKND